MKSTAPPQSNGRLTVDAQRRLLAETPVPTFQRHLQEAGVAPLRAGECRVLQVNVGKLCNQACKHCHVDAGPHQVTANMIWPTFEACLDVARALKPETVDITGGAPELNPNFCRFVVELRSLGIPDIIDRSNLTVLLLRSHADLLDFLAEHRVHIVASLPAVNESQTNAQRGDGAYARSIEALRRLNEKGYAQKGTGLRLTLMSNPPGAFLPPPQASAEERFRALLERHHGIEFDDLVELTNMPIHRFLEYLEASGNTEAYMQRLSAAFNACAMPGLMCRDTVSVGWDGALYDCDFNQMLELAVDLAGSRTVFEYRRELMEGRAIRVAKHCLGCTAGQGSSCRGATA